MPNINFRQKVWHSDGRQRREIGDFWLNGMAGTGKSTIARTIARKYYELGHVGASFFLSRGNGDLSHAGKFFTSIAVQLANRFPALKGYICEAIKEHRDIVHQAFCDQWKQLVFRPLSMLVANGPLSPLVLVVDALDECKSKVEVQAILQLLAEARCLGGIRLCDKQTRFLCFFPLLIGNKKELARSSRLGMQNVS